VSSTLLLVDRLSKTYPGQVALRDASLSVDGGEVHALVGQNGSGKSTLIKLLGGYVKADHGSRVAFDGRPVDLWSAPPEVRRRLRIVHQDLGLVPTLSTIENLGLGRGWRTHAGGWIAWREEAGKAQAELLRFGLAPDVRQPVATLSAAERAAVAIVRALRDWTSEERGILVLDEPTASLNRREVDALFREVRRVTADGNGVIFVSHILEEVLELADRVTVLRDGVVVAGGVPTSALDQHRLVELIVGHSVTGAGRRRADSTLAPPVLEAQGLVGATLRGVNVTVHRGEVLGVAGLVGSGRDELAGCLYGAPPRFAGKVLVDKRKVFASPRESIEAGMAFVPADRKALGLVPADRLVEHVPLPRYGPLQRHGRLMHRATRREVRAWVDRLAVQPPIIGRRMEKFSGGNQQKAVLARWLRTDPKVLLLDEPTQGVDIGAKAGIYTTVHEVANAGTAVLMASSDAEELIEHCDRVLVLRGGLLAAELTGDDITEERIVAETLGSTSNRKATRVRRRSGGPRVIRTDADVEVPSAAPVPLAATTETTADAAPRRAGRVTAWTRRARARWSRR
jgi:ribose transport system ATP-binding protein